MQMLKLPVIRGTIDRRILVNYRVDPGVLEPLLPAPFRPRLFQGKGMVGVCLIRLKRVRPAVLPSWLGISSENAALRAAARWESDSGVFIWRRDTSSWLNTIAGGRVFPGIHRRARFAVRESESRFDVALRSGDGGNDFSTRAQTADYLPATSVFGSLKEAADFFKAGSLGYSATPNPKRFQGLELRCQRWHVEPLEVEECLSSFFDNQALFPKGTIELDCALLMRDIAHEWHGKPDLCCGAKIAA